MSLGFPFSWSGARRASALVMVAAAAAACMHSGSSAAGSGAMQAGSLTMAAPSPDPRVGLKPGLWDAGQAEWNVHLVSTTKPSEKFLGQTNSDLTFIGSYVIQGSYNGYQIWDISTPAHPTLKTAFYCPASQSDVSVYKNLLFVSAEAPTARLDCGGQGVATAVSNERIRGIRIFDISDIANPKYIGNVQTCRGSHTHTVLVDPKDPANVYVYISGSSAPRSTQELTGCSSLSPAKDPNSPLFRIEVIKVPLAHPEQAAIVSSPRIFNDLTKPATHGAATADKEEMAAARARGQYVVKIFGDDYVLPPTFTKPLIDSLAKRHGGVATGADSAEVRGSIQGVVDKMIPKPEDPNAGPTQCHDITVYPAIGYAGGACEGYGLLLDIHDPAHPVRVDAAADSNFSYWHSATFNNDGTKVLFSDEWGGGGAPKCRASDPKQWGADALFTIDANHKMHFQGYYKMSAAQTSQENCVAHNGSLIPVPGRDIMVQAWYQGGISVFDWTDPAHAKEIGYFDRGPVDGSRMAMGGSWSVYWYNGEIVSSEIARGLDVFELTPSPLLTANEIDAAKSVHLDYLNTQGQPKFVWPATFALSRAYTDQLERSSGVSASRAAAIRSALSEAELKSGADRREALNKLAGQLDGDARGSSDAAKAQLLAKSVHDLASATK
jgi:hypothetical protein